MIPKPKLSWRELDFALLESYDLMRRGLLQDHYVLVGEGARCLKENRGLDCDGLDFVIHKKYVTPDVLAMLKEWATPDVREDGFEFVIGKVPLRFRFITGEYDYFKFADTKMYGPEQYKIPNNWKEYWEHREEIA